VTSETLGADLNVILLVGRGHGKKKQMQGWVAGGDRSLFHVYSDSASFGRHFARSLHPFETTNVAEQAGSQGP
jgi:hypothetical protein